jgi:hypothetical protein
MGIPSHQGIGLRPATLRRVPKFQTGHGEEPGLPSDLSAVRAHPCTNRRYASPDFDPPAEHLDRAQETASAEYFERAQEVKTLMLQVQSLGPRSGLTYRKSFSSHDRSGERLLSLPA